MAGIAQRVVIAGGGVAALETALALRELAERRVEVELLAPEPHFWYRPLSVAEPFGLGASTRYELSALASAAGATFTLGALEGVDAAAHEAATSVGPVRYDALVVAVGTVPTVAVTGALTFRGPADTQSIRDLLAEVVAGEVRKVAFAVPWGAVWSLPLYELALMTAAHLRANRVDGVELTLVTPEDEPLLILGPAASAAVGELLDEAGITLVTGSHPVDLADGALRLVPDGRLEVDRVVTLPRLQGARIAGLPQTRGGFIPIDAHARVRGLDDVYAAGDISAFPVKQGGIATQLADAAAQAIAQAAGADLAPQPFRPVFRGLLLTGSQPRYFRHDLAGGSEAGEAASPDPLWWPPAKIVGRYLAPFLAGFAGVESPPEPSSLPGAIRVEVDVEERELDRLAAPRQEEPEGEGDLAGDVMSTDFLAVSPDDVLGEVAQAMCDRDIGSAAVVLDGELIGILTSRDLLRAFAARVDPGRASVRDWMTAEPVAVQASTRIEVAASLMKEHRVEQLPVVDGTRLVGMLGFRQAGRPMPVRGIGLGF